MAALIAVFLYLTAICLVDWIKAAIKGDGAGCWLYAFGLLLSFGALVAAGGYAWAMR